MGRWIAKLADDAYVDWSPVVDAPVSYVLDRAAAVKAWTEERVARADRNGTSIVDSYPAGSTPERMTPEEIVAGNCAGKDESQLTVAEILREYRRPELSEERA